MAVASNPVLLDLFQDTEVSFADLAVQVASKRVPPVSSLY